MKILAAIAALKACLDKFGNVECSFATSKEGNPAIELQDVDSSVANEMSEEEAILRFNARFPIKHIFIPSRN